MLISDEYKFVFLAPTKTGTRSIYHLLKKHYNGYEYQDHGKIIPEKFHNYFTFINKRCPYERAASAYWFSCQRRDDRFKYQQKFEKMKIENNFRNFLKIAGSLFTSTQWSYHVNNRIDAILDIEFLERDFNRLPFITDPLEIVKSNQTNLVDGRNKYFSDKPPSIQIIDTESAKVVERIWADDFENLRYTHKEW